MPGSSCEESNARSASEPEPYKDPSSIENPMLDSFSDPEQVVGEIKPATSFIAGDFSPELSQEASQEGAASDGDVCRAPGMQGGSVGGSDGGQLGASIGGMAGGDVGVCVNAAGDLGMRACHGGSTGDCGGGKDSQSDTFTDGNDDAGGVVGSGASHGGGNDACSESVTEGGGMQGGGGPPAGRTSCVAVLDS